MPCLCSLTSGIRLVDDFILEGVSLLCCWQVLHEIVQVKRKEDRKTIMDGMARGQITPGLIFFTAPFVSFFFIA